MKTEAEIAGAIELFKVAYRNLPDGSKRAQIAGLLAALKWVLGTTPEIAESMDILFNEIRKTNLART